METEQSLQIFPMVMGLAGGLVIFLYGLDLMSDALKKVAGSGMKTLLMRMTTNRFTAALVGTFVTAVIQSSTVTTVLVVGFVTAGLLSLTQSIGIIMGANIGSTVTAQIIAFKVTQYALLLVIAGFLMMTFSQGGHVKRYGSMLLGLGLLFVGMELMSESTSPLRTYQPFIAMMRESDSTFMAILVSTLFTAAIHSSAATTVIVIMFASQGMITLELGIALVFGANIGTCATAAVAAIGQRREAVRAALVHILFNVAGVLIWLAFVDQLAAFVRWISPAAAGLPLSERMAAETPRQIANVHTVFNVANTVIFIWFVTPMARLVQWLLPANAAETQESMEPRYLDNTLLETPDLALDRVRHELTRLGSHILKILSLAPDVVFKQGEKAIEHIVERERDITTLHGHIVKYLGDLSKTDLLDNQVQLLHEYLDIANYYDTINQDIGVNLVTVARDRLDLDIHVSELSRTALDAFHGKIKDALHTTVTALDGPDGEHLDAVVVMKKDIDHLASDLGMHLLQRLTADVPKRKETYRIETEYAENLKNIYRVTRKIAKAVKKINKREQSEKRAA